MTVQVFVVAIPAHTAARQQVKLVAVLLSKGDDQAAIFGVLGQALAHQVRGGVAAQPATGDEQHRVMVYHLWRKIGGDPVGRDPLLR